MSVLIAYDCFLNDIVTAKMSELPRIKQRMVEYYTAPSSQVEQPEPKSVPLAEVLNKYQDKEFI